MKVLLSIKPEFISKIFDGSKKYEYRRIIFKRRDIETIVVYASDPIKRVVGEFDIGEILHKKPEQLWAETYNYAGVTKDFFMNYFAKQAKGYAIEVRKVREYHNHLSLSDLMLSTPPQSFMYLKINPIDYPYDPVRYPLLNTASLPDLALG
ncbi:ASCH domain-containing protein [Chloroflexota bacterium]